MNPPETAVQMSRNDSGRQVRLTLNHPARGNALSAAMVERALDLLSQAEADPEVDSLILQGAGRHFCTGFDLSDLDAESDATLLQRFVRIEQLLDRIWRSPLRTVALAQGRITGAGADLLAACDYRVVNEDATISFPGAGFGLVLGTRRLASRIGADHAFALLTEGRVLTAAQALTLGLASRLAQFDDGHWSDISLPPVSTSRAVTHALRTAMDDGAADRDLAALVRSAAHPGIKARIMAYRAQQRALRETRG